ncbi:uncharacterized protein LOC124302712 isoform X1 [Neodiprion virginianus]|uniref:uncharacterized protein LOC124302712 isoform X1 n=1 Tax=Neodiprion virginianus TaxID=2961670 RepID=UPI001EE744D0|nr:uncharacterized protein LOC124302712 isoform X1 [Neodiprion virginianus]
MDPHECSEIISRHPELILVSNNPVTWEGMLSVTVNAAEKSKVRIKLTLPNFPALNGATLSFGKNPEILCHRDFSRKSRILIESAVTVTSFLKQLQVLIGEALHSHLPCLTSINNHSIISELEAMTHSPCDVRLSTSHGLNLIELVSKNIRVRLQRDARCSDTWKIVSSDLAQLQGCELVVGATMSLHDAGNKLDKQVESLENVWEHLKDIDRNCWVIDPLIPMPHHVYRRIKINSSLSILININPLQPTSLPAIKILGSDSEVAKYREIVSGNFELWDPSNSLSENLRILLNLEEFPQATLTKDEKQCDSGLFNDEECCICFSLELNDNELPEKVCNNNTCGKQFHTACLLQWLQAIPGNQVVFNQLHGACPHCGQNISCPVE